MIRASVHPACPEINAVRLPTTHPPHLFVLAPHVCQASTTPGIDSRSMYYLTEWQLRMLCWRSANKIYFRSTKSIFYSILYCFPPFKFYKLLLACYIPGCQTLLMIKINMHVHYHLFVSLLVRKITIVYSLLRFQHYHSARPLWKMIKDQSNIEDGSCFAIYLLYTWLALALSSFSGLAGFLLQLA